MVKGVVYVTAGTRRSVIALDAATGELLWVHGEHEGARGASGARQLSGRGLCEDRRAGEEVRNERSRRYEAVRRVRNRAGYRSGGRRDRSALHARGYKERRGAGWIVIPRGECPQDAQQYEGARACF